MLMTVLIYLDFFLWMVGQRKYKMRFCKICDRASVDFTDVPFIP